MLRLSIDGGEGVVDFLSQAAAADALFEDDVEDLNIRFHKDFCLDLSACCCCDFIVAAMVGERGPSVCKRETAPKG